jgi:hypothetical protein
MIVSFPQNLFKRAILSTAQGRKIPGWWKHPGILVCTWMSRSIRAQPCIYQIEGLDKS